MSENKLNIAEFLDKDEKKDLLRLLTAGSVDDGKSTLIGRLLFDSKKLYEDQLDALERDTKRFGNAGENIDYALLLDGLKAEREQGITIDVAYRYFSTNSRKFIIADTPGHEQYTRNMITGGSTANLAIILVDARTGVITQTRRHTYLVSLLGIKHIVLAVNKMDLVDYSESRFNEIVEEYRKFASSLNIPDIKCIPLSALKGDNVVEHSDNMPWYKEEPLLTYLETVPVDKDRNFDDFRFPVQYVLRPNLDFRGFSGNIASGIISKGDEIMALPSGKRSHVKEIWGTDGEQEYAFPPQAVTITLTDEIDISRGEMIVKPDNKPTVDRNFEAMLVWMDENKMNAEQPFFIKHTTNLTRVKIDQIKYKVDVNTMEQSACNAMALNEIARVVFTTNKPLFFDAYAKNKSCGSFILIDPITNNTSAVGMIIGSVDRNLMNTQLTEDERMAVASGDSIVTTAMREQLYQQKGAIFAITGTRSAEFGALLERSLFEIGKFVVVLDGSEIANADKVATTLKKQGLIVILSNTIAADASTIVVDDARYMEQVDEIINTIQ